MSEESNSKRFSNLTAVVTGASRGIGAAIAEKLGTMGAQVAVNYRNSRGAARNVVENIENSGSSAFAHRADVSERKEAKQLIHKTREKFGSLDILVNNAGVCRANRFLELDDATLDDVVDTNLKGAFYTTQPASKLMKKQESGTIVNLSSIAAQSGTVDAAYAATKAGILGFTKALARELGPYGIRVNAVAPGPVETDMGADILEFLETNEFHGHENLGTFLEDYAATPEQIANGVSYLIDADFVTGETLTINGGMYTD